MSAIPEQPVYGPAEPRSLDILQGEQAEAAGLVEAVRQEQEAIAQMPTKEQAKLTGHIAMLNEDSKAVDTMQADLLAEATVRKNIDDNRRRDRITEIREGLQAQRERDAVDPIVTDASGNRMRLSEKAAITANQGPTDSGNRY